MQNATQRAQIQNQMAMAELEAATKKDALQQQALQAAQELEVKKQEQLSLLSLHQHEQELQQQKIDQVAKQALNEWNARQQIQHAVESGMAGSEGVPKKTAPEAFLEASARFGPQAGFDNSALAKIMDLSPAGARAGLPDAIASPLKDDQGNVLPGYYTTPTSERGRSVFHVAGEKDTSVAELPGSLGELTAGGKRFKSADLIKYNETKKDIDAIQKRLDSADWSFRKRASEMKKEGKKLTDAQKVWAKEWDDQVGQLGKLKSENEELRKSLDYSQPKSGSTNAPSRFKVIKRG